MNRDSLIENLLFSQVWRLYIDFFIREYGEKLVREISIKVFASNKLNRFLQETQRQRIPPSAIDFLTIVHTSRNFLFFKAEKICLATIMLLNRWNNQVGEPFRISNDKYLNNVMFGIIDKCNNFKTHFSGPNFFDSFYAHLVNFCNENLAHEGQEVPQEAQETTISIKAMPWELIEKLDGLSINQALEEGVINDLGDDEGNFIFEENSGRQYILAQGYQVYLSSLLSETCNESIANEDLAEILGYCKFLIAGKSGEPISFELFLPIEASDPAITDFTEILAKSKSRWQSMPPDLCNKLDGLSINEALEKGIITEIGDDKGQHFVNYGQSGKLAYVIFGAYLVKVSDTLSQANQNCLDVKESDELLGSSKFSKFNDGNFILILPDEINE